MKKRGRVFLILFTAVFLLAFSIPAWAEEGTTQPPAVHTENEQQESSAGLENPVRVEENNAAGQEQENAELGESTEVRTVPVYNVEQALITGEKGEVFGEIKINSEVVLRVRSALNGYSIADRTQIVSRRLQDYIQQGIDPKLIRPVEEKGVWSIRFGENPLITVDNLSALANDSSEGEIAYCWANRLRTVFGVETLELKALALSARATYYSHGWRTASGEVFNPDSFTAAHRTLPFGTLVLVSDLQTRKSVIVRINDRGPFTHGKDIDLSRGAAQVLGDLRRGVYDAKLYILGQN